jgi:hypothetical protein
MTTSLDIIKKHLCPEVPLILKNSDGSNDVIMLKPLDTAQQSLLFKISNNMEKNENGKVNSTDMKEIFDLYKAIIKKSIPEIDEESLDNFVVTNFVSLSDILEKLVPKSEDKEKVDSITKRLEQRKEGIDGKQNN